MLGIALGAAAKSGVDTYEKMLEAKRIQQENEARQRQLDEQEAFKKAFEEQNAARYEGGTDTAELLGQALKFDQDQIKQLQGDFAKMTPGQQQRALQGYARAGYANDGYQETLEDIGVYTDPKTGQALATSTYEKVDPSKRALNVYDKMVKSGNLYGMQQAGDLYRNSRDMERLSKFDEFMGELEYDQKLLRTTINDKGLSGVPEGMKNVLKDNGMSAKYVPGKDGHGHLEVTLKDGNVEKFTNARQLEQAFSRAASIELFERMRPFAADPAELADFITKEFNMRMDKRRADQTDRQIGISAGNLDMRRKEFDRGVYESDRDFNRKVKVEDRNFFHDREDAKNLQDYREDSLDLSRTQLERAGAVTRVVGGKVVRFYPATGETVEMPGISPEQVMTPERMLDIAHKNLEIDETLLNMGRGGLNAQQYQELVTDSINTIMETDPSAAKMSTSEIVNKGIELANYQIEAVTGNTSKGQGGGDDVFDDTPTGRALKEAMGAEGEGTQGESQGNAKSKGKQKPVSFEDRIVRAIEIDQERGNGYEFKRLAREAAQKLAPIEAQIDTMKRALAQTGTLKIPDGVRQQMREEMARLEKEAQLYRGVVKQQRSREGFE